VVVCHERAGHGVRHRRSTTSLEIANRCAHGLRGVSICDIVISVGLAIPHAGPAGDELVGRTTAETSGLPESDEAPTTEVLVVTKRTWEARAP
jgi:hypothetical protein